MTETRETVRNEGAPETPPPETAAAEAGADALDSRKLTEPFKMRKRIGSTVYEVEVRFSAEGGETMDDKILRLVRGGAVKGDKEEGQ